MSVFSVAVYSARTRDRISGAWRRGGPAFYVRLGFRLLGLGVRVVEAVEGCTAEFEHVEDGLGGRESRLLRRPLGCRVGFPEADAALFSPVACEFGVDLVESAARGYGISVVDLQGLLRSCDPGPMGSVRLSLHPMLGLHGVELYKASLEDLGSRLVEAVDFLESGAPAALTLGPGGVVARVDGACILCKPRLVVKGSSVGAGDMLLGFYLYSRLHGLDKIEALCSAVEMVSEALAMLNHARDGASLGSELVELPDGCSAGLASALAGGR